MSVCSKCHEREALRHKSYCRECFNAWKRNKQKNKTPEQRKIDIQKQVQWINNNREKHLQWRRNYNKEHYAKNPLVWTLANLRRRTAGQLTQEELQYYIMLFGEICLRCLSTEHLQWDHIKAVVKGGLTEISSIQILCQPCNSWKGTREIDFRF